MSLEYNFDECDINWDTVRCCGPTVTHEWDRNLSVEMLSNSTNMSAIPYLALHQDYSSVGVSLSDIEDTVKDENRMEEIIVKRLLKGDRGHYGPLEHVSFVFVVRGFPHLTVQQLRTHRVGVSFDVQSFRYTGHTLISAKTGDIPLSDVFYLPYPVWTVDDYTFHKQVLSRYVDQINAGSSLETARYCIPFNVRQHFVFSANVRSLMHLFDMRIKGDVQDITRTCVQMIHDCWKESGELHQVLQWYDEHRLNRGRLAP